MSLTESFKSLAKGDFKDAFNWLYVSSDDVARNNQTTDGLIEVVNREYAKGIIGYDEAQRRKSQIMIDGDYKARFQIPELSPADGFVQGAAEGLANERNMAASALDSVWTGIKSPFVGIYNAIANIGKGTGEGISSALIIIRNILIIGVAVYVLHLLVSAYVAYKKV